jgi:hypothetical protein
VASNAGQSEVLITQTVKDLVAGSGLAFREVGEYELKGVPDAGTSTGSWNRTSNSSHGQIDEDPTFGDVPSPDTLGVVRNLPGCLAPRITLPMSLAPGTGLSRCARPADNQ